MRHSNLPSWLVLNISVIYGLLNLGHWMKVTDNDIQNNPSDWFASSSRAWLP
uniref:AlNc14C267G9909 protein n=1 Tax=Albugo laibachii Nc14 TaxID=890382 RepID=F0WU88_9STRA|nr:AlNc14C267G9909 [Albugo laibachii Nc14]|eukprot:CCA24966.1 AlNc14C267G9909 [Albugo laibachii Nc14]